MGGSSACRSSWLVGKLYAVHSSALSVFLNCRAVSLSAMVSASAGSRAAVSMSSLRPSAARGWAPSDGRRAASCDARPARSAICSAARTKGSAYGGAAAARSCDMKCLSSDGSAPPSPGWLIHSETARITAPAWPITANFTSASSACFFARIDRSISSTISSSPTTNSRCMRIATMTVDSASPRREGCAAAAATHAAKRRGMARRCDTPR
mmetsp:Transcript_9119/g.37339  ORF Transcript_9119/g.37339 Transcript_9119/m.37339 type:complete len:210 (-) Transcript_9119:872-1501(-)